MPLPSDSITATPADSIVPDSAVATPVAVMAGQDGTLRNAAEKTDSLWPRFSGFVAAQEDTATHRPGTSFKALALKDCIPPQAPGLTGRLLPHTFRTDDYITGVLLLGCFMMVWIITRSWHSLRGYLKNFFRVTAESGTATERTNAEAGGHFFIILLTCFAAGLLYYDHVQIRYPDMAAVVSPYALLGCNILVCLLYIFLKMAAYASVNNIFFQPAQNREWHETYVMSLLALGACLLPLTLLVVFFDLGYGKLRFIFIFVFVSIKILLFYKCFRIFFRYRLGCFHLILYFCALEIVPTLALWRTLFRANVYLITII